MSFFRCYMDWIQLDALVSVYIKIYLKSIISTTCILSLKYDKTLKIKNRYLINMVKLRSFFRPVAVAELLSVLSESREHHHDDAALLPHHLPEVRRRVGHRTGCCDVRRVARVVIRLQNRIKKGRIKIVSRRLLKTTSQFLFLSL